MRAILETGCAVAFFAVLAALVLLFLASKLPGPRRSTTIIIDQPIQTVWDVVSDSSKFSDIIHGAWWWGPFDRGTAGPGTSFKKGYILDKKVRQWDYYIVHWMPLIRFSMGPRPSQWDFDFQLSARGDSTELRFSRRFNALGWFPYYGYHMEYTAGAVAGEAKRKKR